VLYKFTYLLTYLLILFYLECHNAVMLYKDGLYVAEYCVRLSDVVVKPIRLEQNVSYCELIMSFVYQVCEVYNATELSSQ